MKSGSNLERVIASGAPAVTAELGPPMSADGEEVVHKAKLLKGFCDAANITDCQTAVVRISSIAAAIMAYQNGLEPVMQMTCRDRNRIAMQADLLGAAAFGLKNCLCIAGDHQSFSAAGRLKGHPGAKNVYDVDTCQLVGIMKKMRDEGKFQGGDDIMNPPKMFIGAAANPFADPFELRVARLAKKMNAGADFIQTQCIYNVDKFEKWMQGAREKGIHEKISILAGITPLKSAGMAKYMKNKVPGMDVPEEVVKRMSGVSKEKQAEEGINICLETIERLKEVEGIKGFHIMAIEWEQKVPEIVERAGLYPRPEV